MIRENAELVSKVSQLDARVDEVYASALQSLNFLTR